MINDHNTSDRRLLGKLHRLGDAALEDHAVVQALVQISLELMESMVTRLVVAMDHPEPWPSEVHLSLHADLQAIAEIAQEQNLIGLQVLAAGLMAHLQWMRQNAEPSAELPRAAAQDLMRMLHELAVGVSKPPHDDLLSALRLPD